VRAAGRPPPRSDRDIAEIEAWHECECVDVGRPDAKPARISCAGVPR
jgi:hypothetical protein